MSVTFTKLFASITESTVWCEPDSTRIVWITMLAMADRKGRVWGSIPGLANRARVTIEQTERALRTFKSPDRYSRTPDNEGRRVEDIDGGWFLLNYEKHRATQDEESVKESKRRYINRRREAERAAKAAAAESETAPNLSKNFSTVDVCRSLSIQAEAEAEAEAEQTKPKAGKAKSTTFIIPPGFEAFWSAYPRKIGKRAAMTAWARLKVNGSFDKVLAAVEQQKRSEQWQKDGGQFIPHPATWLNQGRWDDEPASAMAPSLRVVGPRTV